MFPCPYCANFLGRSFKKLLSHIKFIHSHEPNFSIKCGYCSQTFKKFNSFKSHIQRKKHYHEQSLNTEDDNDTNIPNADFDDSESADGTLYEDGSDDDEETRENHVDTMTRNLALFLLKTKEENQISQNAMNAVLENTSDLVETSLESLKRQIVNCLGDSGVDVSSIEGLKDVLEEQSIYSQAHQRLRTEELQARYFVENFDLVEPEEIVLSQHAEYRYVRGRERLHLVKETFHYIPVVKTLQSLLNQPEVLSQVRNSHCSTDGILRDWCDGECYNQHPLFGQNPHALILNHYYDDFQVTNPLGSKTKKHKIGAFYFTLGNLSPQYRSVINTIQLVALCRVPLINKYGMNRILQPFVQDLHELESNNGVTMNIEGQDRFFQGSIGPFSSDNLGAHAIGGFSENFSSLRICRICMATKEQIQTMFTENEFQLRTRDSYNRQCNLVQNDPSLASTYGLKRKSLLNTSSYFHVVDGLVLDVMHDQLEGVLPLEIKLLLQWCIQEKKYLTLDTLNTRLGRFCYASSDTSNKPSPLKQQVLSSDSASLSQLAAQMWCLARIFPLLIGDCIPHDDEHWENFLRLLAIEEIVFAPQTTNQLAAYLAVLVEEYLDEFGELYERSKIPKQHYMVHYPAHIVRNGPLVRNWAMRFEAKHNYFKKLVYKINNFKNITYSLAKRHQALQAYLLQSSNGNYLRLSLEVGPGTLTSVGDAGLIRTLQLEIDPNTSADTPLTRTSWAKVFGTKYCKGCVIVINLCHGTPVFGEIKEVFILDGNAILLSYNIVRVMEFVQHLNAYRVLKTNECHFVLQRKLLDFYPLGISKGFGLYSNNLFVILKYRIDLLQ